jgi:hypothetical protein
MQPHTYTERSMMIMCPAAVCRRTHCKTTWLRESKDVIAKVNEAKNVNAGLERAKKKKGSVTSTK